MSYKIAFTPQASADFDYGKRTNPKTVEKIKLILRELQEHPFTGMSSRRINHKDRLVYQVNGDVVTVFVLAMHFHYDER